MIDTCKLGFLHSFIHVICTCLAMLCKCVYTALAPFPGHSENGTSLYVRLFGGQFVNWFNQYKTFLIILSLVTLYSTLFDTLVSYSFCCVEIIEITLCNTCLHSSQFITTWVQQLMCMNENLDFDQGQYCTDQQTDSVGHVLPLSPFNKLKWFLKQWHHLRPVLLECNGTLRGARRNTGSLSVFSLSSLNSSWK